ncbi:MAG: hypothetical protein IJH57_05275 [Mogibacterium sp.]|nr:hypothetical protein [Mogibacterium sp.]
MTSPDDDIGTITLDWSLLDDNQDEFDAIDHFNVYKNGNLVAQVSRSAYKESVTQYWDEETDQMAEHHSYDWTLTLDSEPGVVFKWWVTAVSKDGIEGSPSEKYDAAAETEDVSIEGYSAWYEEYHWEDGSTSSKPAILIKIRGGSIYGAEFVNLWRKTGSGAYQFVGKIKYNSVYGDGVYDYADTNISNGTTYTYKATVIDSKKKETEPVEFSIKASEDSGNVSTTNVYYVLDENNNPNFEFWGEQGYTYKMFRNGSKIKEWSGSYEEIIYSDNANALADGAYSYYIETSKGGFTTRSATYHYVKDTSEHEMAQKPGAPSLTARVTGWNKSKIVLSWSKSSEGGAPEGYYIYKKVYDPEYDTDGNLISKKEIFDTSRFSDSDDYISNWWMSEYPQNRYIRLNADKNTYTDSIDWSYEDQFEIRYYVCAYNRYGESDIDEEEIAVFEYNNGDPQSNNDAAAPGKPLIKQTWVEPDEYNENERKCFVTWEAPVGGGVDEYELILQKKQKDGTWAEKDSQEVDIGGLQKAFFSLYNTESGDRGTFRIVVWAKNKFNELIERDDYEDDSANYAVSDEFLISSLPKLSLTAVRSGEGQYSVVLDWTDKSYKSSATADSYVIYRREEYGLWEIISEGGTGISGSEGVFSYTDNDADLEEGTTYYYRIESSADNKTRLSDIRSIHLASTSLLPGQPTGVTVVRLSDSDQHMISWNKPADGGTPLKYVIEYFEDDEWHDSEETPGTGTTYVGPFFGDYRYRIHAENDAGRGEPSEEFTVNGVPGKEDTYWPHSIRPTVTTSTEDDDEPWVTLSWSKDTESNWGEALYYGIYRYDGSSYREELVANIPAEKNKNNYSWTDTNVESGAYYEYYLRPTNTWGYDDVNDYSVWAIPESKKKTSSQIAVEKVAALIDGIEEPVNPVDPAVINQVNQVNEIYESLTAEQKSQIDAVAPASERTEKLKNAVDAIKYVKAQNEYQDGYGQFITKPIQDQIDAACDAIITEYGSVAGINTSIFDDSHKDLYRNLTAARSAYEALSDDAKRTLNTDQLEEIETKINSLRKTQTTDSAVDAVMTKLEALPTVAEYEEADDVTAKTIAYQADAARRAYEVLTTSQKTALAGREGGAVALQKLEALEEAIIERGETDEERQRREQEENEATEAAENVVASIDAIPSSLSIDDKEAVERARSEYNALSSKAQAKVPAEKLNALIAAENEIARLEKEEADRDAAELVEELINNLPNVVDLTLDDEAAVSEAQSSFNALTADQKALVSQVNKDKLVALKTKMSELRAAEDQRLAAAVSELIENLPETEVITAETVSHYEDAIRNARSEYNKLTQNQKRYVSADTLNKLTEAADAVGNIKDPIAAREVEDLIDALPSADALKLSDEVALNSTSKKYDALTERQLALVSKDRKQKLTELKGRMNTLKNVHEWKTVSTKYKYGVDNYKKIVTEKCSICEQQRKRTAATVAYKKGLPAVKIAKAKAGKKKFTAKWKKVSKKNKKKIGGIEIQVQGPGVNSNKLYTVSKGKTSKVIKVPKAKKKYKYRVRAYKGKGIKKQVSKWSGWKTVKVK